jgi:hypothetical protein
MSRSTNQGATISRSYTVVSSRGTTGTYHQQVLAFTIAGNKAPARIFQGFLAAFGRARLIRRGRVQRWLSRAVEAAPCPRQPEGEGDAAMRTRCRAHVTHADLMRERVARARGR